MVCHKATQMSPEAQPLTEGLVVPVVVCLRNLDSAQSEAQAPESYHQPKSVALKVLDWKTPIERRKEGLKSIQY